LKAVLTPLAAPLLAFGALLALAACDQPKPRPVEAQAEAPAATPASAAPAAASAGLAKRAEMAGFSLDVINDAKDPVNTPATISAVGPVTFSGFGFDPVAKMPGAAVDLVIDGVAYPTTYNHQRSDVATYFKTPALENSGFTVTLPAGAIKAGPHQAIVRVVSADKTGYFDSVTIGFVAQ
jgi:membrane-bound lytic murein transglycosylase B